LIQATSTVTAELTVLKSVGIQAEGFRRAVARLQVAVETVDDDGVYIAVLEALNWLPIVAWQLSLNRDNDVRALLYGRHRGSHQSASVIYREEGDVWRWRPAVSLPMPPPDKPQHHHPKLRAEYERRLERQPVLDVFERLPPPLSLPRRQPQGSPAPDQLST
jgi:hypothetical protein